MADIVSKYLDLLDAQRETAFHALQGVSEEHLWKRPTPRAWCIAEILDHNYLLNASFLPLIRAAWKFQNRRAQKKSHREYATGIDDPYRKRSFPMWVGFLWTPRYNPSRRVGLERLMAENRDLHADVRHFYTGKDPALLGNTFVYDPLFGWLNLIVTLRIGIYHDQLHFDDVIRMAGEWRTM